MAKTTDVRPKITLACTECKHRNYITKKNRRNDPDRLELNSGVGDVSLYFGGMAPAPSSEWTEATERLSLSS